MGFSIVIWLFLIIPVLWLTLCSAWLAVPLRWASRCQTSSNLRAQRVKLPQVRGVSFRATGEDKDSEAQGGLQEDWRDFRAQLVRQEQMEQSDGSGESEESPNSGAVEEDSQVQGWAHTTPLIEQGSVLLAAPGDHFALNQQYFHKSVILIIQHDSTGDIGLIVNRPTAVRHSVGNDFSNIENVEKLNLSADLAKESWNVWFGGDCDGMNSDSATQVQFCLHTLSSLADLSKRIIKDVYLVSFIDAQALVAKGAAEKDDFLLLVGYCGWGAGQMQSELDRGDTWVLAAADAQALLGELREAQVSLTKRLTAAKLDRSESNVPLGAADVGDGLEQWQQLYLALGPQCREELNQARESGDDGHADEMLRLWIQRCLLPSSRPNQLVKKIASDSFPLKEGCILRGSATAWLLGKPAEDGAFSQLRFRPAQYLHKAVLLLVRDTAPNEPSALIVLNGPQLGEAPDGTPILFGGTSAKGSNEVYQVAAGSKSLLVKGFEFLQTGMLEEFLQLGALEIADSVTLKDIIEAPCSSRWQVAGGTSTTIFEASMSILGDTQLRKWFKRYMNLETGFDR